MIVEYRVGLAGPSLSESRTDFVPPLGFKVVYDTGPHAGSYEVVGAALHPQGPEPRTVVKLVPA